MPKAIDITGERFGKLVALERVGSTKHGNALWGLRCDCGGSTTAHVGELRAGRRSSCHCGLSKPKHGMSHTPLHRRWSGMKSRCYDTRKLAYQDYGARGIYVCAEWHDFIPFRDWALSSGWDEALQLDRIDNDGPYSPENCQWVTQAENMKNKRPMRKIGLRYTAKEIRSACLRAGIDADQVLDNMPRRGHR